MIKLLMSVTCVWLMNGSRQMLDTPDITLPCDMFL